MDHSMTPPSAGKAVTPLAMAKKVEMWHLDRLIPYAKNARTHSPEQIAQIQASIQEFGFTNPILVDGADGILAGHGRLAAAKDMGLAEVPVIVLDHLSAEQRRAYILADNQLALNAGWDMELLQQEIVGLNLADFDLSLLGFDEDRIAGLCWTRRGSTGRSQRRRITKDLKSTAKKTLVSLSTSVHAATLSSTDDAAPLPWPLESD
jgi:hypothetical protein